MTSHNNHLKSPNKSIIPKKDSEIKKYSSDIIKRGLDLVKDVSQKDTIRELHRFRGHTDGISNLAISSEGTLLASGSYDNSICLWDIKNFEHVGSFFGHSRIVTCMDFLQAKRQIISGDSGGEIILWDIENNFQVINTMRTSKKAWAEEHWENKHHPIAGLKISQNDDYVTVVSGEDNAKIWDFIKGNELYTYPGCSLSVSGKCVFSNDGRKILTHGVDVKLYYWNLDSENLDFCEVIHEDWVENGVAISKNGQFAVFTEFDSNKIIFFDLDKRQIIKQFDINQFVKNDDIPVGEPNIELDDLTAAEIKREESYKAGKTEELETNVGTNAIALSVEKKLAICGNSIGEIFAFNLISGKMIWKVEGHKDSVSCLVISPEGNHLVSGGFDNEIVIWKI